LFENREDKLVAGPGFLGEEIGDGFMVIRSDGGGVPKEGVLVRDNSSVPYKDHIAVPSREREEKVNKARG